MADFRGTPFLLGALLAVRLFPCPLSARAQHFPSDDELRATLRYIVEDAGVPGVVLAVREADGTTRVVTAGSGGDGVQPLGPLSLFEIGSLTKTFTGTLLADMVRRGEVGLEDRVADHLPDGVVVPSLDGEEITLLDLATHHSGLPLWGRHSDPPNPDDPWAGYTVESMYDFLSDLTLERVPGSEYHYSNLGFGLLGHVLARRSGQSFSELVRSRILDPLGMEWTGFAPPDSAAPWMTVGLESNATVAVESDARRGAGGMISNARELLAWLALGASPADSDLGLAVEAAQAPRRTREVPGQSIGLGWWTDTIGGRPVVSHGGRRAGYMANLALDRERGVGTVMLWNTERHQDALGTVLVGLPAPPVAWRATSVATDLDELVGSYRRASGAWAFIGVDGEYLTYQPPGLARARLYPRSDSTFYMLRGPWTVRFERDASGAVSGMRMLIDEREPAMRSELVYARISEEAPTPREIYARDLPASGFGWGPNLWIGLLVVGGFGAGYLVSRRRVARRA